MANIPLWQILWVFAAAHRPARVMFGAWTGPHRSVSQFVALGDASAHPPLFRPGSSARAADRWAFRGGLVALVLLLAVAWLSPSQRSPDTPVGVPDASKAPVAPAVAGATVNQRPDRHIDADLKNAILVHVPKTKRVRMVVLKDDAEADQFSWEIDAFLRAEGYTVVPRLLFAIAAGGQTPSGTTIYPDEKDANILVIRIGLNDRSVEARQHKGPAFGQAFAMGSSLIRTSGSRALAGRDLVVLAVLAPLVEHVVDRGDVALLVVADRAEHGVPLAGLDGLGDLLGVGGLGLRRRPASRSASRRRCRACSPPDRRSCP